MWESVEMMKALCGSGNTTFPLCFKSDALFPGNTLYVLSSLRYDENTIAGTIQLLVGILSFLRLSFNTYHHHTQSWTINQNVLIYDSWNFKKLTWTISRGRIRAGLGVILNTTVGPGCLFNSSCKGCWSRWGQWHKRKCHYPYLDYSTQLLLNLKGKGVQTRLSIWRHVIKSLCWSRAGRGWVNLDGGTPSDWGLMNGTLPHVLENARMYQLASPSNCLDGCKASFLLPFAAEEEFLLVCCPIHCQGIRFATMGNRRVS